MIVYPALSIPIGGEWFKPSTDFNLNHKHKIAAPAPKLTSFQPTSTHSNSQPSSKNNVYHLWNALVPCHMQQNSKSGISHQKKDPLSGGGKYRLSDAPHPLSLHPCTYSHKRSRQAVPYIGLSLIPVAQIDIRDFIGTICAMSCP